LIFVVEAGLVAIGQRERWAVVRYGIKGEGDSLFVGNAAAAVLSHPLFLQAHSVVQESGFDAGVAGETPSGGRDLVDEMQFG
jgi:hypothetical protein